MSQTSPTPITLTTDLTVGQAIEASYNEFLTTCAPWDLHTLLKDELYWHDTYVSCKHTLPEFLSLLAERRGDPISYGDCQFD